MLGMILAACSHVPSPADRSRHAREIAARAGMIGEVVEAGRFRLQSYHRGLDDTGTERGVHVYIEGDGLAYLDRRRRSPDPTPVDPLGLRLAAADPYPRVIYVARPCQYIGGPACNPQVWTTGRFAVEQVVAMEEAVDRLAGGRPVEILVGYSGGGTVATLLAGPPPVLRGHLPDPGSRICALVTVASPLALADWTAYHHVTPLAGALDPAGHAEPGDDIPMTHLVGQSDRIVPPVVQQRYTAGHPASRLIPLPGFDHHCCWAENWPRLLRQAIPGEPACRM